MIDEGQGPSRPALAAARPQFSDADLIDVASIIVTAAVAVAVATNERNFIRPVAAVIFVLFVPGRAIVSNWPALAERSQFAVSVLFSLTVLTLAATFILWSDVWRPLGLLEVECVITAVALFAAIVRRRRAADAREVLKTERGQST